jgi:hypothetical protein
MIGELENKLLGRSRVGISAHHHIIACHQGEDPPHKMATLKNDTRQDNDTVGGRDENETLG